MARQEPRHGVRVFHSRRKTDATHLGRNCLKFGEAQHKLITTFAFGQCVDFIDDDTGDAREHAWRVLVTKEQGEAFWRCQQDVRRINSLSFLLRGGRIASAIFHADLKAHFFNGRAQIAFDVRRQRFQRRDIDGVQALVRAL